MDFPCRLCLVECSTNNLTSIFKCSLKHTEDSLVDILFWVFAVEVDVTDLYSKAICDDCIQLIEYVVEIRNTFQKTQQSLQGSFVGNRCEEFEVLSSEGSVNDKQTKPRSITPSTSSSKHNDKQTKPRSITPSTSSSKHSYCSSSPRIRVPLSTLETMCSLTVDLERFEHSQDFMRYRELGKGRFKKRKYRHFNLDDSLLEDICNTLDDKKLQKIEIVSTEKNSNIKETNVSTELCVSSINESCLLNPGNVLLEKMAVTANKNHEAYILEDIIDNRKNLTSSLPTPQIKKDSDWTRITSTKDIGTNTEPILSPETRSIGITVDVDMIEAGTLTKNFKQKKPKDTIRMKIQTLDKISPSISVWLEPVERLLGRENYKEIDDFCYVKMNNKEESEKDIKIEAITQVPQKKAESPIELRKQRFVEYYHSIPSFAVRELIEGRNFRAKAMPNKSSFCSSDNEPIFKVSNVSHVFVCKFCSRSFLSEFILNRHYARAHKPLNIHQFDENGSPILKQVKKKRKNGAKKLLKKSISLDLGPKTSITKYNGIIRNKMKFNQNSPKVIKGKRKQKFKKDKKEKTNKLVDKKYIEDTQFVWERKSLGTYTALAHVKTTT